MATTLLPHLDLDTNTTATWSGHDFRR